MASRSEVERYAKANRQLRELILRDLRAYWANLDLSNIDKVRPVLEKAVPLLVIRYGEMAATVAADFYDELRSHSVQPRRYAAVMADPPEVARIQASTRWALGSLLGAAPDPDAALGALETVADRMALRQGRGTIGRNVHRDPADARWARVPVGGTCDWCLMLASRGAVYMSEKSAGGASEWHGKCDCTPTPIWRGDDLPDGYDPDGLYETYRQRQSAAGTTPQVGPPRVSQGFNNMSRQGVEKQISILEGLKDSDYKTKQLARLRKRLSQL